MPLLGHRDQRVRQGAQHELAKRGRGELLLAVARDASAPRLARVHAVWGVGQLLRRKAATLAAVVLLLSDADGEIRTQAVKILGDVASAKSEAKRLIPLLTDPEPRVRLQSAIALGKLGEPSAVEALFAFAAKESDVPVLRHAAVMGLVGCATTEQLVAKRSDPSVNVRLVSVVALRRLAAPQLAEFLEDADGRVVEEAARAIHDDLGVPAALPALAAMVAKRSPSEILTRRAINANLRLGTPGGAASASSA